MISPDALDVPTDPHDAAAYWFAREHGGLMSAAERETFDAWLRADAAHIQAYREMRAVWQVAQAVPDRRLRPIVTPAADAAPHFAMRRYMLGGLATACGAAVVAGIWGPRWAAGEPVFSERYATGRGERRQAALPDGSLLMLNTATVAHVTFYDAQRTVLLQEGEVMFSIAPDAQRPFVVHTELGQVRVTGTRFDVRVDAERLDVAVESGSVEVTAGAWWRRFTRMLAPGQGLRIAAGLSAAAPARQVDVAAMTAWRQGKVVFDSVPLAEVVDEINRYRNRPVRVQGALRQLRIAGVFNIDDTDTFLAVLPTLAPVLVVPGADGGSEIVAR